MALTSIKIEVDLFKETGKWGHRFQCEIDYERVKFNARALLEDIDAKQDAVVKGTVTGGGYFVVINDAPQQALTPQESFFMNRLFTPSQVRSIMAGEEPAVRRLTP